MSTVEVTTEQANKETIRRFFVAFAANDDAVLDEILAPDFTGHAMPPGLGDDAAGMKKFTALVHAGLHDCRCDIDDMVAEGDRVVARYTTRGIHGGDLFGTPPSGRAVTMTGIEIYRLSNGRVAELWGEYDMSDVTGQAG